MVYKCLHNMAPGYLSSLCQPVSSVIGTSARLIVANWTIYLRINLSMYGGRAFAYDGPTIWNSLPDDLKLLICATK